MAPRIRVCAILSCDPSWRGLAFTLFIPSMNFSRSFLYDLKEYDTSKLYRHPTRTIQSIQKVYNDMFQDEERLQLVDKVIMESQHKPNMQTLSWLLLANLLPRLGEVSVQYVSPLACKRNFEIALTGTHHGNKVAATEFVENSKNRLVASETVSEHNTADACLLLNTYLETTKNTILKNLDDWSVMTTIKVSTAGNPGTKLYCPKCKNATGLVRKCLKEDSKIYGKHFLTCWWTHNKGQDNAKECKNYKALYENVPKAVNGYVDKTWKVWKEGDPMSLNDAAAEDPIEDDDDVVEVGSKRRVEPAKQAPPAKRIAAAPPPVPTGGPNLSLTVGQFGTTLKKATDALKLHLESKVQDSERNILERVVLCESGIQQILHILQTIQDGQEPEQGEVEQSQQIEGTSGNSSQQEQLTQVKLVTKQDLEEIDF